jgi:hypothetical protein
MFHILPAHAAEAEIYLPGATPARAYRAVLSLSYVLCAVQEQKQDMRTS